MNKVYLDSETCGLHSIMVLYQWAIDDGPIHLHEIWREPVGKTLELFEDHAKKAVVGFNLSFDWFHVAKIYTMWRLLDPDWIPEDHINEVVEVEHEAQNGPCIKPSQALDLLLHSRRGEFQSLMSRDDIRIRQVPTALAYSLAKELEERIEIDGIYFAKAKDKEAPKWKVYDRHKRDGSVDSVFKDVVLKFKPGGGLKFLAEHVLKQKSAHFSEIEVPRKFTPPDKQFGFLPTAKLMSQGGAKDKWRIWGKRKVKGVIEPKLLGYAWPKCIRIHIDHWANNDNAREYANKDIVYTRALDQYFGSPEPGDNDSELACMVGAVRWHGYTINVEGMKVLRDKAQAIVDKSPVNINAHKQVRAYLEECFDEMENVSSEIARANSTSKPVLKKLSKLSWSKEDHNEVCTRCGGERCHRCRQTGVIDAHADKQFNKIGKVEVGNHPVAERAAKILEVKAAAKEVELFDKLIRAGKFHPDFNIIGTLSSRMSGGSGLNAQGIKSDKSVRSLFPLSFPGYTLSGGDFDSFEVVLAATVYDDEDLNNALTTKKKCEGCKHGQVCPTCNGTGWTEDKRFFCASCANPKKNEPGSGKVTCKVCEGVGEYREKIHGLFGMAMYPGNSYSDILDSSGTSNDMYTNGKSGVFGLIYGGDWKTLVRNFGIDDDVAKAAEERFFNMFPGIRDARQGVAKKFTGISQPDGGAVYWNEPDEHVESFLGFRRYFTLENRIRHQLFMLAKKPPKHWRDKDVKVVRKMHKGVQTAAGAVASALYGASFGMQGQIIRQAGNHEIQSPGGEICKHVQRKVWDLQPAGVHEFVVMPMNVHDEIMCVTRDDYVEKVGESVHDAVESFRERVPLIGMTWNLEQENWSDKKAGSRTLNIQAAEMK